MNKLLKISILSTGIVSLSGCASLELLAVGGVSYLLTGKGLTDHAVSAVMEKDCAFHHLLSEQPICLEEPLEPAEEVLVAAQTATPANDNEQPQNTDLVARVGIEHESIQASFTAEQQFTAVNSNHAELYAVIGSFNDLKFAYERSMLYRNYNTLIVENPENSTTRFRVVIGPLKNKQLLQFIAVDKSAAPLQEIWTVELCSENLAPPPCSGTQMLAKLPVSDV